MAKFKSVIPNFQAIKAAVAEKEKKSEELYNNALVFKPKLVQGQDLTKFRIRFLPIEESSTGKPWVKVPYHMFERPGDGKFVKVIDPKMLDPKAPNPISAYATKLWNGDNPLDKEMAKKLFVKDRYFTLVYIKSAPENQQQYVGRVLIYEIGKKLYDKLFATINEFEKCFWDPYKGQDFLLVIKETGDEKKKWPDYSMSDWFGDSGTPIENDEKLMEKIAGEAEKVSIKAEIIEKEGVKTAAELTELLFGGTEHVEVAKTPSRPAVELVSEVMTSKKKVEPDFGAETASKPKTTPKKEKPVEKVVEKTETKVSTDEVQVNAEDINIDDVMNSLNESDFQ